jgi:N-acetylglucosaminyldiphosphoundecaprenol N-acetyl-beta-D-mannosaminyltransferase
MTVNDIGSGLPTQAGKRLLYGLQIDPIRMDDVVARCRAAVDTHTPLLLGVLNAAKVVNLKKDPVLRDALLQCDLLLADGQSIVWASKLLGRPLPERVAGIDIFEQLLAVAEKDGRSIYLLGARPDVLEKLVVRLGMRFPRLRIAGRHHGYFKEEEGATIAADIQASGADMLFLGMVSPKKEIFLGNFASRLDVPVLHGVGGSFDILAGITKRAPLLWQRMGIEWLYRVLQEPRRMWRRYLTTNFWFLLLTARELVAPSPALGGNGQGSVPLPKDQPAEA